MLLRSTPSETSPYFTVSVRRTYRRIKIPLVCRTVRHCTMIVITRWCQTWRKALGLGRRWFHTIYRGTVMVRFSCRSDTKLLAIFAPTRESWCAFKIFWWYLTPPRRVMSDNSVDDIILTSFLTAAGNNRIRRFSLLSCSIDEGLPRRYDAIPHGDKASVNVAWPKCPIRGFIKISMQDKRGGRSSGATWLLWWRLAHFEDKSSPWQSSSRASAITSRWQMQAT